MVGINKYDAKDRRRARRRNHVERDLRFPKLKDRKIKSINGDDDDKFYEELYFDED